MAATPMTVEQDSEESTVTSLDDENTENLCDNPTRDLLADGLISLFKPIVHRLEQHVQNTRLSQIELKQQLDHLSEKLHAIEASQQTPIYLDDYVKKLINVKHKVTVIFNVLQASQERLNRIYQNIEREKLKRKTLLYSEMSTSQVYQNYHVNNTGNNQQENQ